MSPANSTPQSRVPTPTRRRRASRLQSVARREHVEIPQSDEEITRSDFEQSMGFAFEEVVEGAPWKARVYDVLYHPVVELSIFALIITSIVMLGIEVSIPKAGAVGWLGGMDSDAARHRFFVADVAISAVFVVEYGLKLAVAPNKWLFFRRNWIDFLAILPALRVLRLGRVLRLLRLLRLLRFVKIGNTLFHQLGGIGDGLSERRGEGLIVAIYIIFSVTFGTVGIMVFERGADSGFETLLDGLWWSIVTMTTVGYGDMYPITTGGRLVAVIVMFIGLSFYAFLTGLLSTILIERSRRTRETDMDIQTLSGHVVVCGWNDHAMELLDDIYNASELAHLVVLTTRTDVGLAPLPRVHVVHGDPTTPDGLRAAGVAKARTCIVLANQVEGRDPNDTDARTILTVLAVERTNPDVHTVAEILNEHNEFHLENAGVDDIIVSGAFTGRMLAQVVRSPGVAQIYRDLFRPGGRSHFAEVALPKDLTGRSCADIAAEFMRRGFGVFLGYRRGTSVTFAPDGGERTMAGDRAIIIRRDTGDA